jgi:hypothetical protein
MEERVARCRMERMGALQGRAGEGRGGREEGNGTMKGEYRRGGAAATNTATIEARGQKRVLR